MYSMHNEEKSVYKYMTSVSKNVYIDKLDDIVNKFNNACYSTIKMKPIDVKSSTYIDSSKEINNKDHKFKIGDIVWISKYENIFSKVYTPNWSEKGFVIKKVKSMCRGHMLLMILMEKKLLETFTKKNCKKANQKEFRMEKVIKRKGDKLYVKWKGYNKLFNTWIDKKT